MWSLFIPSVVMCSKYFFYAHNKLVAESEDLGPSFIVLNEKEWAMVIWKKKKVKYF